MKPIHSAIAAAALISFGMVSQQAFAGKAPVLCGSWQAGKAVQDCTFTGGAKTAKIGAAPDGYPEKWATKTNMSSPFKCEPATFGGNPFDGTAYTGKLDCYVE